MQDERRIRSFVLRAGRTTPAQLRALTELWPAYGISPSGTVGDFDAIFGRRAARCLEIGFGVGEVIGQLARERPGVDHVGIEVHAAGIGRLLLQAQRESLQNLKVIRGDAAQLVRGFIPDHSFDEVLIFFPDPWHKKRHHKRRLIDAGFIAALADKLRPAGVLRLATDWPGYAEQMLQVCNAETRLVSMSDDRTFVARPAFRPPTRFERRGARLGHSTWDLAYLLRPPISAASRPEARQDDAGAP